MYRLTYKFEAHPEGLKREELPADHGACDAMLLVSMIYPPDGSYSQAVVGVDGRNTATGPNGERLELAAKEQFKAWIMSAKYFAELEGLDPGRRLFAAEVFDHFCAIVSAATAAKPEPH